MSLPEPFARIGRLAVRTICILAIAGLAGGCFQPLYGEHSFGGNANVRGKL